MTIRCQSRDCGKPAPDDLKFKMVSACIFSDVIQLYSTDFYSFDCPYCGAKKSVRPSLAGLFLVEQVILLLDQGFDPEAAACEALAPLVTKTSATFSAIRVSDLAEFKSVFAVKMKAVAQLYPYSTLNPNSPEENITHWRCLQGEVLSALLAGAVGIVPKFGVRAGDSEGNAENLESTIDIIRDLVVWLISSWSMSIQLLTEKNNLEEILLRLIDTCSPIGLVADRLVETLDAIAQRIEAADVGLLPVFHFHAVEASVYVILGRQYPKALQWAYEYLLVRCWAQQQIREGKDDRLLLSPGRISCTINYKNAWDAVGAHLVSVLKIVDKTSRNEQLDILSSAANDLGHGNLFRAVLTKGWYVGANQNVKVDDSIDYEDWVTPESTAIWILERGDNFKGQISSMLHVIRPTWLSRSDAVAQFFDLLEPAVIDEPEDRAGLLSWFGERMKLLGTPTLALDRIGRDAATWEHQLGDSAKMSLWTERSNALRLAGERVAALNVAIAVLEITFACQDVGDDEKKVALLNVGVLLRENGRHEESLTILLEAEKIKSASDQWMVYHSLSVTLLQMGRIADAAEALATARKTAGGRDAEGMQVSLLVSEIAARLRLDQREQAETLLCECPVPEGIPEEALVPYSSVFRLLTRGRRTDNRQTASIVLERLIGRVTRYQQYGNFLEAKYANISAALLANDFFLPGTEALWKRDIELSAKLGRPPDPITVLGLMIPGIQNDLTTFNSWISSLRDAIVHEAGGVPVDSVTMDLLSPLDGPFGQLARIAFSRGLGPYAVQTVAELRRNAHQKARKTVHNEASASHPGLAVARSMRSGDAPFIVLEWCDTDKESLIGIVTSILPGSATCGFLEIFSDLDIVGIAHRIGARLDNWRLSRTEEPHLVPQWELLTQWLKEIAARNLPDGGHVVIIDHPAFIRLPFHIALAPTWTVSYTPDWRSIEAIVRSNNIFPTPPRLGILHAPRTNETAAVRDALSSAADHMRQLAETKALDCVHFGPGSADADAFHQLLAATDVLKILCHGQISKEDCEVALLIDHDGEAPPGYSFGAVQQQLSNHRFGRSQFKSVERSPRIVFLGSCSSGIVSVAGLDERTSVAILLNETGTKAVVAPRWKIDADLALPVLGNAIEYFLDGSPLVEAVAQAAEAAVARGVPKWQAHAFIVEGDWKCAL